MGSTGPLGHPELRAIEKLLDADDVVEAKRRLGEVGPLAEFADGITYLATRLLYLRGRLDVRGVADRLRELIAKSEPFPEARAFLEAAEHGRIKTLAPSPVSLARPGGEPAKAGSSPETAVVIRGGTGAAPEAPPVDTTAAKKASWPPPSTFPKPPESKPPGRPASKAPAAPAPQANEKRSPSSQPETVRASPRPAAERTSDAPPGAAAKPQRRRFTPISNLDALSDWPGRAAQDRPRQIIPDIPKAPAIPQFRSNSAPPSYAPEDKPQEFDPIHSKSLLPLGAGRYSETPIAAEVVESRRRRPQRPVRRGTTPPAGPSARPRYAHSAPPNAVPIVRQGPAPKSDAPLPSLFEIASWIDEGRHKDAIGAINRAGPEAGPEYGVLRARALAGAGYADQAYDALERLDAAKDLEPELRAACARLFVELGDPARALESAKIALDGDPNRPLVRLTYALAAIRTARRRPNEELIESAQRALAAVEGREGPLPAAYQALKACVQAAIGDPERAISIAQRALGLDPRSPDALAGITQAAARLGRATDARQAWARLREIAPEEAEALVPILSRAGVAPKDPRIKASGDQPLWAPAEIDLSEGRRVEAIQAVEEMAREMFGRVSKSVAESGFTAIATVASTFLTLAPVLSSFAPFDLSLFGLRRLDAGMDLLYGPDRRPRLPNDDFGIVLLLGSYIGETIRLTRAGHWEGNLTELENARLTIQDDEWYPFRVVKARLQMGRRARFADALSNVFTPPGTDTWRIRLSNPIAPPMPWAPHAWPKPSEIRAIGRSLTRSPIGMYCADFAEGALDRSTASLIALDSYLDLVAPTKGTPDPDAGWTRRVAVLAGGYLGETLRELIGGEWVYGADTADDALSFRLVLRGTLQTHPVGQVLERLIGARTSTLVDYAKTLMRRAGRA